MMLGWALAVGIFLLAVTLHEVAHGYAAHRFGDDTAKRAGRLTLNPLKHIDPFWTVLLPIAMFISTGGKIAIGQAKPVPVNFANLKPLRPGMILVALAGPAANFLLAGLSAIAYHATGEALILFLGVYLNLALAVFNLFPIPPLDGSRILLALLPRGLAKRFVALEPYGFFLVIGLYYVGFLRTGVIAGIRFFSALLHVPVY